jgi:nitrate reductase gamma subunit
MPREIFLMRGVWKNRRSLWPFSYALHAGIYLFVITLSLHLTNAIFIIAAVPAPVRDVFLRIASIVAIAGYISGALGAVGLILIRLLDGNYRPFTTRSMYFRLVFLGAVFISGIGAWCATPLFAMEASWFVNNLVTLDKGIAVAPPLAAHIVISLLFIIYLPLTDMLHFIAKYFTHHSVRWNDAPLNSRMERRLRVLLQSPADWAAPHAGRGKSWAEIAVGKKKNAEET